MFLELWAHWFGTHWSIDEKEARMQVEDIEIATSKSF